VSIAVTFPGGKRVDAEVEGHVIRTDQSAAHGGDGSAPEPFQLFLASIATCTGIYVLGFCQARGIPTDGIRITQHHRFDPATHRLDHVGIELALPASFPEKYRASVLQVAGACKVKKVLMSPPAIEITAVDAGASAPA
jgi:ribosomal protein S12 methylthiotransferase accessory factor